MIHKLNFLILISLLFISNTYSQVKIEGSLVQYQPIILVIEGPEVSETGSINPFLDYKLEASFMNGKQYFKALGYFAADGNASESSAESGNVWHVRFTPNMSGEWLYQISFKQGENIAISHDTYKGISIKEIDGKSGSFKIKTSSEISSGFHSKGRLTYKNSRYLHTENGKAMLKFGPNSPENFLAFKDIDGTYSYDTNKVFLKTWEAHIDDWNDGDPTWKNGKGKGIIGALNYQASKGMNCIYALTMNIGGDARDVWPFLSHERKDFLRYDVSKLAQWDIVFSHAEKLGIIMHLITQETENELLLDDGYTIKERKLYYRELVARFAHHQNIIWNMGEENGPPPWEPQGQNDQQRLSMIRYLSEINTYNNPIVIHTLPAQDMRKPILDALLGYKQLYGVSMQIADVYSIHNDIKYWVKQSEEKHHPWIVSMDEIGPWHTGTRPDDDDPKHDTLRQEVLWGTLMAGGAGVEWYFGWLKPPHDLNAEDWRSRNNIWEQTAAAHEFFKQIPYTEMKSTDDLLADSVNYCFSKHNDTYAIYLKNGGSTKLNLEDTKGEFSVLWYNPRTGGELKKGSVKKVKAGKWVEIGTAPSDEDNDWTVLVKRQ